MSRTVAARMPMLSLTAAAVGMAASTAMAAEWAFQPSAQLSTQAQDNPRMLVDGGDAETSLGARAGLQASRRTETLNLTANAGAGYQRYERDVGLDRNDQQLDLALNWQGELVSWRGSASATRDTTLTSELGVTGLTQFNQRHEGYEASIGPSWQVSERLSMGSRLGWQVDRYPNPETQLSDYRYGTAMVNAIYALSDRTTVTLVGSAGHYTAENTGRVTDNASVSFQASYAWSPLWSITAGVGPSWSKANDSDSRERSVVYNFMVGRQLERASVSLFASRSQSPSGFGVLTEADEAGLDFEAQITERLSASVNLGLLRRKDALPAFRVDLQNLRYRRADIGVAWVLAENLKLVAGVGNKVQRLGTLAGSGSAENYEARLGLSWIGNPHVY
jgi:hypothetical protein